MIIRQPIRQQWVFLPFEWKLDGPFICVWDERGDRRSITNAAEDVVRWFAERGYLFREDEGARRILYRDSDGVWDELAHDGKRFKAFRPIGGTSLEAAKARAAERP